MQDKRVHMQLGILFIEMFSFICFYTSSIKLLTYLLTYLQKLPKVSQIFNAETASYYIILLRINIKIPATSQLAANFR